MKTIEKIKDYFIPTRKLHRDIDRVSVEINKVVTLARELVRSLGENPDEHKLADCLKRAIDEVNRRSDKLFTLQMMAAILNEQLEEKNKTIEGLQDKVMDLKRK